MVISECLSQASTALRKVGIASAQLDAELILGYVMHKPREFLMAYPDMKISSSEANKINKLLQRRLNREPLAYILGRKEFYGREFSVNKNVLTPRPETEQLIEILKKSLDTQTQSEHDANAKILDIGTGSGILAITAKLEFPNTQVFASDISPKALEVARQNARRLGANVKFMRSNLLSDISGQFDVILANLPYVAPEWQAEKTYPELNFEPVIALFAKDNGLKLIKQLIVQTPQNLKRDGLLILEMDLQQIAEIANFAQQHNFEVANQTPFALGLKFIG